MANKVDMFKVVKWLSIVSVVLFIAFVAYITNAEAKDLGVVDPTITGNEKLTFTCNYPIAREDDTPLAIGEIAKVNFFVEKNGTGGYFPAGENTTACSQIYDLTQVEDGDYVYVATVTDTDGRESLYSIDNPDNAANGEDGFISLTVKRVANPRSLTGVDGSLGS